MELTEISPLFWPVREAGEGFSVLDETLLPEEIRYLPVTSSSEAVEIVRKMKTRAFGQVLTFFHTVLLVLKTSSHTERQALEATVGELGHAFSEARPTFAFLGLANQVLSWLAGTEAADPKPFVIEQIKRHLRILRSMREKRAKLAASLLPQSCSILTHCNLSGDMVLIGNLLRERKAKVRFFATETRPYLQGTRLTAWELTKAGFEVHLVPDRGAAQAMEKGLVDVVLVGSDRATRSGDVINKVGTYPLAVMAKANGIPFYALVQDVEGMLDDTVPIEERPPEEMLYFDGHRLAPEGVGCRYPAFDVTPASLITNLVGFSSTYGARDFKEKFGRGKKAVANWQTEEENYVLLFGVPRPELYRHLLEGIRIEGSGEILIPEMRPGLIGVREVAPALLRAGLKPVLVSDNMLGFFFQRGAIRRAYLAYREFTPSGPVVPAGGSMVVRLARANETPIELTPAASEESPSMDVDATTLFKKNVAPPGVLPYPIEDETIPWAAF